MDYIYISGYVQIFTFIAETILNQTKIISSISCSLILVPTWWVTPVKPAIFDMEKDPNGLG